MSLKSASGLKRRFSEALKEARLGVRDAQYDVGLMYANGLGVESSLSQAVYWIRQAAEKGHPGAQYLLGTRYVSGVGVEKDPIHAQFWLQKAAFQGHGKAHLKLGLLHRDSGGGLALGYLRQAAAMGVTEAAYYLGAAAEASNDWESALSWYSQAQERKDVRGIYALGQLLRHGKSGTADPKEAAMLYRKAARSHYPPALVALKELDAAGFGRGDNAHVSKVGNIDFERRLDSIDWAASLDQDDAYARYCLGRMYEEGIKVPVRLDDARKWYLSAATSGDRDACWAVSRLLDRQGLHQESEEWCNRAAELGVPEAQTALAQRLASSKSLSEDLLRAASLLNSAAMGGGAGSKVAFSDFLLNQGESCSYLLLLAAARDGDAEAQYRIGNARRFGRMSVGVDLELAAHWFEVSAQTGHVQAQVALAGLLLNGLGVQRDHQQAFYWFFAAAEQGDQVAQWNVSNFFRTGGGGVDLDLKQSYQWCLRSANQGFVPAQAALGVLLMKMKKPKEALEYLHLAADAGDGEAQFNLGSWLEKNPSDCEKYGSGMHWLLEAAHKGIPVAQAKLAVKYATGKGVPLDLIEASKWFHIAGQNGEPASSENLNRALKLLTSEQVEEAQRRALNWIGSSRPGRPN